MGAQERVVYRPRAGEHRVYEGLYRDYLELARQFGEERFGIMKRLRARRTGSTGAAEA
jgi:hypothetical protein